MANLAFHGDFDLLRPFPADEMEAFEVSKDVGNVKNNSESLLNSA
jgi:putative SOS response-associated peptidase YedK